MKNCFLIQTTVFVLYVEVTNSTVLYYCLCCTQAEAKIWTPWEKSCQVSLPCVKGVLQPSRSACFAQTVPTPGTCYSMDIIHRVRWSPSAPIVKGNFYASKCEPFSEAVQPGLPAGHGTENTFMLSSFLRCLYTFSNLLQTNHRGSQML